MVKSNPFIDDAICPKCGSQRLVRRRRDIASPKPADGVPIGLWLRWFWARRHGHAIVVRRTYHCEMCGAGWATDELAGE
ncbi:MAG: hypothetical protein ACYC5M_02500 [Anaerolineae bacterium]